MLLMAKTPVIHSALRSSAFHLWMQPIWMQSADWLCPLRLCMSVALSAITSAYFPDYSSAGKVDQRRNQSQLPVKVGCVWGFPSLGIFQLFLLLGKTLTNQKLTKESKKGHCEGSQIIKNNKKNLVQRRRSATAHRKWASECQAVCDKESRLIATKQKRKKQTGMPACYKEIELAV